MSELSSESSKSSRRKPTKVATQKTKGYEVSSSKKIVVPYDENTAGFINTAYIEEHLQEYISHDEFNQVISRCSKKMQWAWMWVRDNDKTKISGLLKFFFLLTVGLLISYIVGIICVVEMIYFNEAAVMLSFFCFVCGTSIAFGISIYNHCRKDKKYRPAEEIAKEKIDKIFEEVNSKLKGIEFSYNINANQIAHQLLLNRKTTHRKEHLKYKWIPWKKR